MKRFRPRRPSAALVISVIALIAALGGTAYAGVTLSKNSVGSKQLKNNAVTTSKIKNNAVTTSKIKNGAVNGSKLNLSGVTVPNATHASTADSATKATSATSAANATNATNATNAANVDGQSIKGFSQTVATGTTTQIGVLSFDGVTLTMSCATGEPLVQATAAESGAFLRGTKVGTAGAFTMGTSVAVSGSPITAFNTGDGRGTFDLHYLQTDGHRVDINAAVDDHNTINNFDGCLLEGTAIAG